MAVMQAPEDLPRAPSGGESETEGDTGGAPSNVQDADRDRHAQEMVIGFLAKQLKGNHNSSVVSSSTALAAMKSALDGSPPSRSIDHVLQAKILAGGLTNYSFQVFVQNNPSIKVFAKLSFANIRWDVQGHLPETLDRQQVEFDMLQRLSQLGLPVPKPLLMGSVQEEDPNATCMLTEWAAVSEQWANHFIDGQVSDANLTNMASALAQVQSLPVQDTNLNASMRHLLNVHWEDIKHNIDRALFEDHTEASPQAFARTDDVCVQYARQTLGQATIHRYVDLALEDYNARQALVHGDAHPFNVLVASPQEDGDASLQTNDDDKIILCDWELAVVGPVGRDVGLFQSFPIQCILVHAALGHKEEAVHMWNQLKHVFWKTYMDQYQGSYSRAQIFRSMMISCALYSIHLSYALGLFQEGLPLKNMPVHLACQAVASQGYIGLRMWELAFDGNDNENLEDALDAVVMSEMERLWAAAESSSVPRRRRSSILRLQGRRISDASLHVLLRPSMSSSGLQGHPRLSVVDANMNVESKI